MKMDKANKKKKNKILVIVIPIVLIILICIGVYVVKENKKEEKLKTDNIDFKNEYEALNGQLTEDGKEYPEVNIPEENVMNYSDINEVLKLFKDKKDGIVYLGSAKSLYSRSAIEVLLNETAKTKIDKVYYLEIEKTKTENKEKYNELKELLGEEYFDKENNTNDLQIPLVLFIVDGNVVSYQKGTLFSQVSPYDELNEDQKTGLGEIYRYGIRDVLEGMKN